MIVIRTPGDDSTLRRNVAASLARRRPEQRRIVKQAGRLTIIANGPSAAHLPDHILRRPGTLAVNGALGLFTARGLAPRWWLALDPQPLVADFLSRAPRKTHYLVASQCAPQVFDALAGHVVQVWHVHNPATLPLLSAESHIVCAGVTATLGAIAVGRGLLGYRRIEIYGWDGCRIEGVDHAVPQGFAGRSCRFAFAGQVWDTSPDWLAESEDARERLNFVDAEVAVHGPGFMGAYLRHHGVAT